MLPNVIEAIYMVQGKRGGGVGVPLRRVGRRRRASELPVSAGGTHRWNFGNELGGESLASCCASAAMGPDVCV